jgi:hypothetical protein
MMALAGAGHSLNGVPRGTTVVPSTGVLVPRSSCVAVSVKQPVVLMSWMELVQMCNHWQSSAQKAAPLKTLPEMAQ